MLIDRSSSLELLCSICDVVLRVSHKTCLPPNCIKSLEKLEERTPKYIFSSLKDDCRCLFFHHLYLFTIFWGFFFLRNFSFTRVLRLGAAETAEFFPRPASRKLTIFKEQKLHHFSSPPSKVEPQTITNLCLFFSKPEK